MKKKTHKQAWEIWQGHHAQYEPPVIFRITRMEHFIIGCRLQPHWKKHGYSKGAKQLMNWIFKNYSKNKEVIK